MISTKKKKNVIFRKRETRRRLSSARHQSDSDSSGKFICIIVGSIQFILFYSIVFGRY